MHELYYQRKFSWQTCQFQTNGHGQSSQPSCQPHHVKHIIMSSASSIHSTILFLARYRLKCPEEDAQKALEELVHVEAAEARCPGHPLFSQAVTI